MREPFQRLTLRKSGRIRREQVEGDSIYLDSRVLIKERRELIRVCCYKGCGTVYGEKEPLSDKRPTHGICPEHVDIFVKEIKEILGMTGGLKVLMVEDSPLFRQYFKEMFHNRFPSIEIYEATAGEEALQKIENLRPDLIFMDIGLPGENGLEITKKVKARYRNIIVIMLTGHDSPEYREASLQYADYFLSKDSSTSENIFALVESVLPTHA